MEASQRTPEQQKSFESAVDLALDLGYVYENGEWKHPAATAPAATTTATTEPDRWPIRVGGVYRGTGASGFTAKVIAISLSTDPRFQGMHVVHFEHWYKGDSQPFKLSEFSAGGFRLAFAPEDASPVSALVEALQKIRDMATDPEWDRSYTFGSIVGVVDEAIALARNKEVR